MTGCSLGVSSAVRPLCMDWVVRWLAAVDLQAAASAPTLQIGHARASATTGKPHLSSA